MTVFGFASCQVEPGYVYTEARNGEEDEIKLVYTHPGYIFHVVEITYRDETHEFIETNKGQLVHWPGCKYCEKYKNILDLEKIQ